MRVRPQISAFGSWPLASRRENADSISQQEAEKRYGASSMVVFLLLLVVGFCSGSSEITDSGFESRLRTRLLEAGASPCFADAAYSFVCACHRLHQLRQPAQPQDALQQELRDESGFATAVEHSADSLQVNRQHREVQVSLGASVAAASTLGAPLPTPREHQSGRSEYGGSDKESRASLEVEDQVLGSQSSPSFPQAPAGARAGAGAPERGTTDVTASPRAEQARDWAGGDMRHGGILERGFATEQSSQPSPTFPGSTAGECRSERQSCAGALPKAGASSPLFLRGSACNASSETTYLQQPKRHEWAPMGDLTAGHNSHRPPAEVTASFSSLVREAVSPLAVSCRLVSSCERSRGTQDESDNATSGRVPAMATSCVHRAVTV